jgi:hypothetical protein
VRSRGFPHFGCNVSDRTLAECPATGEIKLA